MEGLSAPCQTSDDGFLRFCNRQQPHHGYCPRGGAVATLLLGAHER